MADLRICSMPECGKKHKGLGYCPMHLRRFRLYGDPQKTKQTPSGELLNWIERHVSHEGDACLIWPFGCNSGGRPTIHFAGRQQMAARIMCIKAHGEPPSDRSESAHSCGRGHEACMHPKHIRWDDRVGNQADRRSHGTDNGSERNGMSRLTREQASQILQLAMQGSLTAHEIAKRFSVSRATVYSIKSNRRWRDLRNAAPQKG